MVPLMNKNVFLTPNTTQKLQLAGTGSASESLFFLEIFAERLLIGERSYLGSSRMLSGLNLIRSTVLGFLCPSTGTM